METIQNVLINTHLVAPESIWPLSTFRSIVSSSSLQNKSTEQTAGQTQGKHEGQGSFLIIPALRWLQQVQELPKEKQHTGELHDAWTTVCSNDWRGEESHCVSFQSRAAR